MRLIFNHTGDAGYLLGAALAAIAGLRGTGDWATDERPKNFREYILWRNPNGTTPLFALTAKVKKEATTDPEFNWWDEPNDLVRLQVNGTGVNDTTSTTVTVDSADPSSAAPGNNWGVASHLKAGDLLLVEPAADAATYNHEIVEVTSVISDTQFTIRRGAAGTTAAAIANDTYLLLIGSNFSEGTAEPSAASRKPIKYNNYTQIFKDVYEVTGTASQTTTRTGDVLATERKRKSFDHARGIEFALLFGQGSEITGENGKPKRTTKGVRAFIPSGNTTILSNGYTMANLLDAISPVFDYETEAGDQRIVFAGNSSLNYFNKLIAAQTGAVQIQFQGEKTVYGMSFNAYRTPQGMLYIKVHPLLNRHTLYKNSWFIIDFSVLRWRPMKGRDTKFMDNIQTKGEDLVKGQWLTEGGLEVRGGGLTLGYIGKFNA